MPATGESILRLARRHLGEKYVLGTLAPKNNPRWTGPWDCAEFVSWLIYRTAGKLYGCEYNSGDPASADAYTGFWARDANAEGQRTSVEQAARTPGSAVLRTPQAGAMGHIVVSDGRGGTVEAHSSRRGVIESTLAKRRWDMGILVPGISYRELDAVEIAQPRTVIFRLIEPLMKGPQVREIQRGLRETGFSPGPIDGLFGPMTQAAVVAFQASKGLVVDGEVGPQTARALGITLRAP